MWRDVLDLLPTLQESDWVLESKKGPALPMSTSQHERYLQGERRCR